MVLRSWPRRISVAPVAVGLWLVSVVLLLLQSEALSLSRAEVETLQLLDSLNQLLHRVHDHGLSRLTDAQARKVFNQSESRPIFLLLFNTWVQSFDGGLTASRLGQILFNSLAPVGLWWWFRPMLGHPWALAVAISPWLLPRWLSGAVMLESDVVLATAWVLILGCQAQFMRARTAKRRIRWALVAGCSFGVGLALSWFTLLVAALLPAIATTYTDRVSSRKGHGGHVKLPSVLIACLFVGSVVLLLLSPQVFALGPLKLAATWLRQMGPNDQARPSMLLGTEGQSESHAAWLQLDWVVLTTPVAILIGFTGAIALLTLMLASRIRPRNLGGWSRVVGAASHIRGPLTSAAIVVIAVLVWPLLGQAQSAPFRPRPELLLPFVAALSVLPAWCLARCIRASVMPLRLAAAALLCLAVFGMGTGPSSFSWLAGGPTTIHRTERYPVATWTELQPLATQLGSQAVNSSDLSGQWLTQMVTLGRAEWRVASSPQQAEVQLTRLPQKTSEHLVKRGRLVLWAATAR